MNLSKLIPISSIHADRTLSPGDDISGLAKSIEDDGLQFPVLLTEDNRLIDGLRRIEAIQSLGYTSVPAIPVMLFLPAASHLKRTREHGVEAKPLTPRRIWELYKATRPLMNMSRAQRMRDGYFGKSLYIGGRKEFIDAVGIDKESYLQAVTQLYRAAEEQHSPQSDLARELVAQVDDGTLTVYMAMNRMVNERRRGDIVGATQQLSALQTAAQTLAGVGHGLTKLGPLDPGLKPQHIDSVLTDLRLFRRQLIQLIHNLEKESKRHE